MSWPFLYRVPAYMRGFTHFDCRVAALPVTCPFLLPLLWLHYGLTRTQRHPHYFGSLPQQRFLHFRIARRTRPSPYHFLPFYLPAVLPVPPDGVTLC